MQRLLVDQSTITSTALDTGSETALQPGQARLRLRRFALTANNVTYAATGFQIGYWTFFPSGTEGQGSVPVWGFAEVVESHSDALEVGARLYGFFPMAETLDITPKAAGSRVILDAAPHRADLPPVYNRYTRVREKPADAEGLQALLQPLLATSWLLADWLQDNAFFGAEQVIVGSASSKTGLGLCAYLHEIPDRSVQIVGLTSAGNRAFVEALGTCDSVVTYDAIDTLSQRPSVYVDMAGNLGVNRALHSHLAGVLKHSSAVGLSHWDQFGKPVDLAPPKPEFFFAPARIEKRRADWGPGAVEAKIGEAVGRVAEGAGAWMEMRHHDGLAAAQTVYGAIAGGTADPRHGHVINL